MEKIKSFFRAIFNWIKENPAIQPLLIILFVFLFIFSLTKVSVVYDAITDLFPSSLKKPKEVDFDGVNALFDRDDDFILVYGAESCSACKNFLEGAMNRYLKQKNRLDAFYFDYDNAYEEEKKTTIQLAEQRERLFNTSGIDFTNSYDFESLSTPTLFFFHDGNPYRVYVGTLSYSALKEFVNLKPFVDPNKG